MLFNSPEFLLIFLSIGLAGFYILSRFVNLRAGTCYLVLAKAANAAYFDFSSAFDDNLFPITTTSPPKAHISLPPPSPSISTLD